jgi:hypothetical protein
MYVRVDALGSKVERVETALSRISVISDRRWRWCVLR